MLWQSILFILTLLGLWKIYTNIIKPYREVCQYRKYFASTKYKVHQSKFIPFASDIILIGIKDVKEHNDSFYTVKNLAPQYDLSLCNFGNKPFIILNKPQLIQELFARDTSGQYQKEKQIIRGVKRLVGTGITLTQGDLWKTKRKYATIFLNYNYINSQANTIGNIIQNRLNQFSKGKQTFAANLLQICEEITSTTVVQLFFGGGNTDIANLKIQDLKIGRYVRQLLEQLGQQLFDPLGIIFGYKLFEYGLKKRDRQVTRKLKLYHMATKAFIQQRIQQIKEEKSIKEDYISMIYKIVPEQERNQKFFSSLTDDFTALFAAGTDTTSHSSIMMIYFCVLHPQVMTKLQDQIDKFVKDDTKITSDILKEMKYLDYVFHQTLRYFQPANGIFFRQAQFDHYLGDIPIRKGTMLGISSLCNHYDPKNFENPHQFKPERWMKEDGSTITPKSFTWLPFSAGNRGCVGKTLAQLEMKLITAIIFKRYKLTLDTKVLNMRQTDFSYQPQKITTTFQKRQ